MFVMYSFDLIKLLTGIDYLETENSTGHEADDTYSDDRADKSTDNPPNLVIDEVSEDKEFSEKNSRQSVKSL